MQIVCDKMGVSVQNATLSNPGDVFYSFLTGGDNDHVKPEDALSSTAAAYCINIIANDVGRLPLWLYFTKGPNDVEQDLSHPAGRVMRQVNHTLTQYQLRRGLQLDALLYGNGRAFITRNGRGEPDSLIPLDPAKSVTVTIQKLPIDKPQKFHVVFYGDANDYMTIPDRDVFHIYVASLEKYSGNDPSKQFGTSYGLSLDGDKFSRNFYKNNGTPSIVLEAPAGAFRKPEDAQEFLARWNEHHSGPKNAGKAALLREGTKASVLGSALRDNQLVEQREFQVKEMMRAYGVHMVPGVSDSQSYNTLVQHNRAYLNHGLDHWLRIWEQEAESKLLTSRELIEGRYYFDFDTNSLTLPDGQERAEMYSTFVRGMIKTINECRAEMSLPPVEGGDKIFNPAIAINPTDPQPEPTPSEPKSDPATTARVRSWLVAESREVARMAGKARNFTDWASEFYAKHKAKFPGSPEQSQHVVDCHLAQLNDIAGSCTQDTFAATVAAAVKEWPTEAEQIAEDLING